VNFGINVTFRDIFFVSESLIKSVWVGNWIGSWESDFGSIWNESCLRSWPCKSLDVLVGEILDVFVNVLLRNIHTSSLIENVWVGNWIGSWESDFRSIWNESLFGSWPGKSLDVLVGEILDILINFLFRDVSTTSLGKTWMSLFSIVESGVGLGDLWVKSMNLFWLWVIGS